MRKLRMLAACEMSGRVRDAFAARGWEAWSADLLPSESPVNVYRAHSGWNHLGLYPGNHYVGDVRDLFVKRHPVNYMTYLERQRYVPRDAEGRIPIWDLVIAFPPCTHLSLAGARYWKAKQQPRWNGIEWIPSLQAEAADFFMQMTAAPAPYVAVENPVGIMGRKKDPLYRVPDQAVQPYWFGDPRAKKTCLWLKDLPLLVATDMVTPTGRSATGGGSYRVDKRNTGKANNTYEDGEGRARRHILRSLTPYGLANAMASQWGAYIEERTAA